MTRKRYIPYKYEIYCFFIYAIEKMKMGEWNQTEMIAVTQAILKRHGHEGYNPPGDMEDKITGIANRIGRRVFEPAWRNGERSGGGRKRPAMARESYDYSYKHYILVVLLNLKHQIVCGGFNYREYLSIVEKTLFGHGYTNYHPVHDPEEKIDKIIGVYENRIFEYPVKKRRQRK
jgi:hypothetical protein